MTPPATEPLTVAEVKKYLGLEAEGEKGAD